ncbi:MAG: MnmA/TRMU family protein, partial [Terriglobia bacterium]
GRFRLRRGLDRQKDQSYVLYSADQTVLSRVIMPLGEVQKSETRDIAHRHGLPIAAKPESQEICFVTEGDYRGFLAGKLDDLPGRGAIVNDAGERIGSHNGYVNYTVGQRRGLNLPGPEKKYVLRVDPRRNEVVVGREDQTYSTSLEADDVVFVGRDLERPARLTAMTRYNSFPATGLVTPLDNGCVRLDFERPQRAVTPGQAVVFYDGDEVVGGGTIKTGGWAASV